MIPGAEITMQHLQKDGHFARVCKTKTVNRVREENETGSNTESYPELEHIQSVNGVNRKDFYTAILFVEGQLIEFILDTGYPITKIPPLFNPKELMNTTKCFEDAKKNPN